MKERKMNWGLKVKSCKKILFFYIQVKFSFLLHLKQFLDKYRDKSKLREVFPPLSLYYSGCHWKVYKCFFMKQNCYFQICMYLGLLQYKNATKPLSSSGVYILALLKKVYNFAFAHWAQNLPAIKVWKITFP